MSDEPRNYRYPLVEPRQAYHRAKHRRPSPAVAVIKWTIVSFVVGMAALVFVMVTVATIMAVRGE